MNVNDLLSISQVAEMKDVSARTVHSWIKRGIAPTHHRLGDRTFFEKQAAEAFVKPKRGIKCKKPVG
jgi:DNA-binding transcriptional MerR regulator